MHLYLFSILKRTLYQTLIFHSLLNMSKLSTPSSLQQRNRNRLSTGIITFPTTCLLSTIFLPSTPLTSPLPPLISSHTNPQAPLLYPHVTYHTFQRPSNQMPPRTPPTTCFSTAVRRPDRRKKYGTAERCPLRSPVSPPPPCANQVLR